MNYIWHYNSLIITRKFRERIEGNYYERHHIIPRSMKGDNSPENLVYLTAREHFLAHWLLWKIFNNRSMLYAFICMNNFKSKRTLNRKIFSSIAFAQARENSKLIGISQETIEKKRISMLGKNTGIRSQEIRDKMSMNRRGIVPIRTKKYKYSEAGIESMKMRFLGDKNPRFGVIVSESTKKKISDKRKGMIVPFKGKLKSFIFYKDDIEILTVNGQKSALNFCRENNLSSILIKKSLLWKEWKCKII